MSDQYREFIAEDREAALTAAQSHFGVGAERLDVVEVPESLRISNLGARTLLLVGPKQASEELGEVGEFMKRALELLGFGAGLKLGELSEEDGQIQIRARGSALEQADRRVNGLESALSHLADRAAQALIDEEASAVVSLVRDAGGARGRSGRDRDRGDRDRGGRGRDRDRDRDRGRDRDRDRGRGGRGGGRDRDRDRGRDGRGRRESRDDRPRSQAEEELEATARDAAREVQDGGDDKLLPAMSSRERWVVHNAIKEIRGVNSESVGEGARRRVRIFAE